MPPERKGVVVERYEAQHIPAVRALNERLRGANQTLRIPESEVPEWLPRGRHHALYQDYYVARDADAVRGCFILKWQPFAVAGRLENIAAYQFPVSEGIIERAHAMIGVHLLKDALRRSPQLFMLGLGGRGNPAAQLLSALKWTLIDCPFFFHVARPYRFLRGMRYLRARPGRRLIVDAAAFTGLGSIGIRAVHWWRRRGRALAHTAVVVNDFGAWADRIWAESSTAYTFIAQRDASILNVLYPAHDARFTRLRIDVDGTPAGWAVVLNTPMQAHKYFGDLRVGSLADCLALPGHERTVVAAARRFLARGGADVVVTNQLAPPWCAACRDEGFLTGPSNFILALSPRLAERLQPLDTARIHMTRGDGDGPINL
jgi:hypothetical protein